MKTTFMIKIFTASLLLTAVLFQSCKKNDIKPKPAVADIPLFADIMKSSADTSYTDIPYPCTLQLNSSMTWTLTLKDAESHGTYSWTPTVPYTAQIKFNILQWTTPASDTAKAAKLKSILETVDKCEFPGTSIYGVNFSSNNYTTLLRTAKQ